MRGRILTTNRETNRKGPQSTGALLCVSSGTAYGAPQVPKPRELMFVHTFG